jgi:hypothetical protein
MERGLIYINFTLHETQIAQRGFDLVKQRMLDVGVDFTSYLQCQTVGNRTQMSPDR